MQLNFLLKSGQCVQGAGVGFGRNNALADAAFATPVGGVSEPVQTDFGWHVLKITGIEAPTSRPLAQVHDELRADLASEKAADLAFERANKVEDALAGGATLEEVASWAAFHSKARTAGKVPVIYTQKKYVRKPRGAKPGTVYVEREKMLMVRPVEPPREQMSDAAPE